MIFIELFTPRGALTDAQRRQVSERMAPALMQLEGMSAEIQERARALGWMVVHEMDTWTIGGQLPAPDALPTYFVRVSVPGGHLDAGMRTEIITRITRVLAEIDANPERLYQEPAAWIHIIEVPDGNMGAFGVPVRTADIGKLVMQPGYRVSSPAAPDGPTVVDPICGMTVALTPDAITLEYAGTTYGFCCAACRDLFVQQQHEAATVKNMEAS